MRSPLQELRERLKLTVGEMAQALGLMYATYYSAEKGMAPIPGKAKPALEELGVDVDELMERHSQWISKRAAAQRHAILHRVRAA